MEDFIACTIASKNYLAHVRTLAKSFHKFYPNQRFILMLVDRVDGCFDPEEEKFEIILINDLKIENFDVFVFQYNILELNTYE